MLITEGESLVERTFLIKSANKLLIEWSIWKLQVIILTLR